MSEPEITLHTISYTLDTEYSCEQKADGTSLHIWAHKEPIDIHVDGLTITEAGRNWLATYCKPTYTVTIYGQPVRRRRTWPFARIYRQWAADIRAKKIARRQHRAAFRRRKRGLA